MNFCINKDIILSKIEIKKLRKAYNNYDISEYYLNAEVENIMINENIDKEEAIERILKLVFKFCD